MVTRTLSSKFSKHGRTTLECSGFVYYGYFVYLYSRFFGRYLCKKPKPKYVKLNLFDITMQTIT